MVTQITEWERSYNFHAEVIGVEIDVERPGLRLQNRNQSAAKTL